MTTQQLRQEKAMNRRPKTLRELDRRRGDGIEVALLWHPRSGRVLIAVEDTRNSDSFEFEVEPADALPAFHHPFLYLAGGKSQRPLAATA
jgi:hypothetical protein